MNRWICAKFGGTSVASARRWTTVRDVVRKSGRSDRKVLVVCSAVAGISDLLDRILAAADAGEDIDPLVEAVSGRHLALGTDLGIEVEEFVEKGCQKIFSLLRGFAESGRIPAAVRAEVMAVGELLSTRIGSRWLETQGLRVVWRDARELLRAEPSPHGACASQRYLSATCCFEADPALLGSVDRTDVDAVVTQGFIARNARDETVLLGRGGSDTAAAAFAAKLGAERLEIWSDVPGVFSANPRTTSEARLLTLLDYDEAETLAGLGAGVLHAPSIHPARSAGVPIHLKWTERPDMQHGTRIETRPEEVGKGLKAVVSRDHICLITISCKDGWQPLDFMPNVAQCFRHHAVAMDLISCSSGRIQVTVDLASREGIPERIPGLLESLGEDCETDIDPDVASVSLVGRGVRDTMHQYGPKLEVLRGQEVRMMSAGANNLNLTLVVPSGSEARLLRELHRELFEEFTLGDEFGPTWAEIVDGAAGSGGAPLRRAEPVAAS